MISKVQKVLPALPLRDVVLFPGMVVPLFVGREKSIYALESCMERKVDLFLIAQKQASVVNPKKKDLYEVGTVGTILQILKLPDHTVKVLMEGKQRAKLLNLKETDRFFEAKVEIFSEEMEVTPELEAVCRLLKNNFESYVKLNKRIPPEILMNIQSIEDPSSLGDLIVSHMNLKMLEKQKILEIFDMKPRLEQILKFMKNEVEILQIEKRIQSRVKKQMERSQKEYYLTEQMQAIQKELGEKDEFKAELIELEKKAKAKHLSVEARERVSREIKKLKLMAPLSAEAAVIRNYIDWILSLPWKQNTKDKQNLSFAKEVLEKDHFGLEEVKERILEFLSVQMFTQKGGGQVLCLVGPPGVGKTSLARSIARTLGKRFVRSSLGGVRDEAEIRGHRRTYVGALPGKIIQHMKKSGSSNPVFLLDEIDKMSVDFRGDPSAALLEVLDPEQNSFFEDHYLEVPYDLSKVFFILTANSLYSIPRPLLDRMEVISISGYTYEEKFQIAKNFLWMKQCKKHGLKDTQVKLTSSALKSLILKYTKEAGVRNLERSLAKLCRKVVRRLVEAGEKRKKISMRIEKKHIESFLGPALFFEKKREPAPRVGLVNGLAYTECGGELLHIEVSVVCGKGDVRVTGQLGKVMQESAWTAMSYVRSKAHLLGLDPDFYQKIDVHLHVPEGAVPKDGPSAGIAMVTSLTSALTNIAVRQDLAMTGEVTLRGQVLPIGGLREKLLAAKLARIKTVLIPKENAPELKKIPNSIWKDLEILFVEQADEVLRLALELKSPETFLMASSEIAFTPVHVAQRTFSEKNPLLPQ